jgi:N-methylhydantoinase A/oxoprolinase/acetone carboxylase beta subunit
MPAAVRIGIDVGGTFTHAVALDAATLKVLGKSKVPTTHSAAEGVARGIINSLHVLLEKTKLDPADVTFIAHSTTQATNALLEGDVAPVGILAMGKGASAALARLHANVGSIELAKGRFLKTYFEFIDTSRGELTRETVEPALKRLAAAGARAIAVSEAFSVDDKSNEEKALEITRELGFMASSGSEVSKLYGLRVRTRTAVINAAMLPKMIETADMTESSVRAAGIKSPIMIMRSDGGVMDIDSMRKRPILTRLSGPAAGVAAAMMYLRISDGIFLEVGGTSTDISVIRNGKALVKDAEIGGHRVYLRSLDVNTLGIAGGSMLRLDAKHVKDVGPRSAHIAGLSYVAFADSIDGAKVEFISPRPEDPPDYLAIKSPAGDCTLTPTCAANFLGFVPEGDCASGKKEQIAQGFKLLADKLESTPEAVASEIMDKAYEKCWPALKKFIAEYKLDMDSITLIGGGGGAAAIVPYVAKKLGVPHALAENADVVSAIGVALALVRETVERQVAQPKPDDLIKIREEAFNAVASMGADPSGIEVHVEVDPRANILRATAYGATGLTETQTGSGAATEEERLQIVKDSFRASKTIDVVAETDYFTIYGSEAVDRKLFGLLSTKQQALRALDRKGVIRLKMKDGRVRKVACSAVEKAIADLAEEHAHYGDAGKIIPDFMIVAGPKIIDLSGLQDTWQVQALARSELSLVPADADTVVLAAMP